jgi:hypothetical protein
LVEPKYIVVVCDFYSTAAGPMKDMRKRTYQEDFMKFWFTSAVINGHEMLQCIMSCEALANDPFEGKKINATYANKTWFSH